MGWGSKKIHPAQPGQVSMQSEDGDTVIPDDVTMTYPGFIPQRYIRPVMLDTHDIIPAKNGEEVIGHEPGDGTVPNNTDRGMYGHGVIVDSDVAPKNHSRHDLTDNVKQRMPVLEDNFQYDPIKVTVVDKLPDERQVLSVATYHITTQGSANGGQPMQTGLTPIRIAGKDPFRTRLIVAISNMQGGSTPMLLTSEQTIPSYGFPLSAAANQPMPLFTSEELWVSGIATTDDFVVCVIYERSVQNDPRG